MLRATFYGFNIAFSGLMTAQKALDLTGNNISNMNTPGYTRQRLDLNSIPSSSYTDRYAPRNNVAIGQGVNVTKVAQLRDPFLDARFRNEAANIGTLDSHLSALRDVARIFDEVQYEALNKAIEDFRTQLQVYSGQTGAALIDTTVWAAAESVVKMFNQYSRQLTEVRNYQEFLMRENAVPEVNRMLENLAMLNKNIRECEIFGNPALELKDQRNLLLDQLSAHMKIEVSYRPDPDEVLARRGVEIMSVSFVSDSVPPMSLPERTLVDGANYTNLVYHKNSITGEISLTKQTPQPNNLTKMLNMITDPGADPMIGGYTTEEWATMWEAILGTPLDPAATLTTDLSHVTPGEPIRLWQDYWNDYFNNRWDGEGDMDPFRTDLEPPPGRALDFTSGALKGALEMLNSKGAFDNPPNIVNGIGYYEAVLDQIVRDFAETMNNANAYIDPAGPYALYWADDDNVAAWDAYWDAVNEARAAAGRLPLTAVQKNPYSIPDDVDFLPRPEVFFPDEFPGITYPPPSAEPLLYDRPLFTTSFRDADGILQENTTGITASNIQIASGWKSGSYHLTTSKNVELDGDWSGDTSNLMYMISLLETKFTFTTGGIGADTDPAAGNIRIYHGTFEEMFKTIGLTAAQDVRSKEQALRANANVIMGIEDMRNSLSSVSYDEEGVNLLRFQESYAANARVMTTLDEALEVLINRMGIVGR